MNAESNFDLARAIWAVHPVRPKGAVPGTYEQTLSLLKIAQQVLRLASDLRSHPDLLEHLSQTMARLLPRRSTRPDRGQLPQGLDRNPTAASRTHTSSRCTVKSE